jgi:hypothetical protein
MFDDQEATIRLMVTFSQEYILIYGFLKILAAVVGFSLASWVLLCLGRVHLTRTLPPEKFSWGLAIPALLVAGCLGGFVSVMSMVSVSFLDAGGGSLFPTALDEGANPIKLSGLFAEQTARFLGWILGFIGLTAMGFSRLPEGDRSKFTSGLVRLCMGGILIRARDLGNMFGGMGDNFFG